MPTAESPISHLTQDPLSENDKAILAGLVDWLSKAKVEKINADNFELCVDSELSEKWTLLKDMNLVEKVQEIVSKLELSLIYDYLVSNSSMVDNTDTGS